MHPDLRLGLVLVAAALLLTLGGPASFLANQARQLPGLSAVSYGLILTAGGVGGLAVIAAAIWVDRRPPHAMMAAGALASLLGLSVFALPAGFAVFTVGMFVAGVGSSAVNPVILYAIAVKGSHSLQGYDNRGVDHGLSPQPRYARRYRLAVWSLHVIHTGHRSAYLGRRSTTVCGPATRLRGRLWTGSGAAGEARRAGGLESLALGDDGLFCSCSGLNCY